MCGRRCVCLGGLAGARLLGEIGDDCTRFADARKLRAHADSAPVTRASDQSRVVTHRRIKNDRLATVASAGRGFG
ncbi:transposase [Pseudonocardia yunnanensis]|uniref:Transposase n=1 Tax=Pseudonocardia yunnanensis TaxID=58107 RepID=A0ABW4F7R1_9PSEU